MPKLKSLFLASALLAMTTTSLPYAAMAQSTAPSSAPATKGKATDDAIAQALRDRGEAYRRAPDEKQDPQEQRVTNALNSEILDQNDLAEMQDRANQSAHAKAQAEYQSELARVDAERARIDAQTAATEAAYAVRLQQYERQRADWQACVAGDRSRCR